ncbi:MAG TPA: GNAT family N-acetyltransferase, partial [Polyangia bacterium]
MKVRAYEERDRGELERLARAMFPDADDPFGSDVAWFVIDRGDGRLGGYVEAGTRPYAEGCDTSPVAYVEAWYVDEDLRRRGWGGKLFAAVEDWARAHGHRELASGSLIDNETSIAAHKSLGFREVERQVCFAKR